MLILVNFDYSRTYFISIIEINIKIKKTIKDKIKRMLHTIHIFKK